MKNDCSIVKELLPLYAEDMVSAETAYFIQQHLEECEECRSEFERLNIPVVQAINTNTEPLKEIKRQFRRNKVNTILLISSLLVVFLISLFSYLTAPKYYSYSDDLLAVSEIGPGSINISFNKKVTGYRVLEESAPDDDRRIIHIEAWSTVWEKAFFKHGSQNAVIYKVDERPLAIYFTENHTGNYSDEDDHLIYGTSRTTHGGAVTLPGLSLGWGLIVAGLILVVSLTLFIIMKIKGCLAAWNIHLIMLPLVYILGHLCVLHFNIVSYSVVRDFSLIMLVAVILYCAALLALNIYRSRKEIDRVTKGL